jgi:hypothetical protein
MAAPVLPSHADSQERPAPSEGQTSQPDPTPHESDVATDRTVLRAIEKQLADSGQPDILTDLWMSTELPITDLAPTESDIQYSYNGVRYDLVNVDASASPLIRARLEKLVALPASHCYDAAEPLLRIQPHTRCRFVRQIALNGDTVKGAASALVDRWSAQYGRMRTIWVESATRVTSTGAPLGKVRPSRPIAIATDSALFLVVEQLNDPARFAKQPVVTGTPAFTLASVADVNGSATRLRDIFFDELSTTFADAPLLTSRDLAERQTPTRIVFKRWNLKSNVVGRESFVKWEWWNTTFERSTFAVDWKCDDGCSTILIDLDHTFFVSVDNREYKEERWPAEQIQYYMELYRRAATDAYRKSIRKTCRRLAGLGMMSGDVCRVRGDIP